MFPAKGSSLSATSTSPREYPPRWRCGFGFRRRPKLSVPDYDGFSEVSFMLKNKTFGVFFAGSLF